MQAIIMAAGRGSRLGNLTDDCPKAMLKVRGHRLIDYSLALLHQNGIQDIKIVTGYHNEQYEALAEQIPGVTCIYNPFYEMFNVLGSFFMAQDKLSDEETIYMHADTLCDPEIFQDMVTADGDIVLPVDFKHCDQEAMKVRTKDGKVIEISKEIPENFGEGEFIGIAKLSASVMPAIRQAAKKLLEQKQFKSYFEGAIQEVINQGGYTTPAIATEGRFWGEVDFLEDYQYVEENLSCSLKSLMDK